MKKLSNVSRIIIAIGSLALIIMFFRALSTKRRNYDTVPVEVMATYWHFVDAVWLVVFGLIYLG